MKKKLTIVFVFSFLYVTSNAQVPVTPKVKTVTKAPAIKIKPTVDLVKSTTVTFTPHEINELFPTEIMSGDGELLKENELRIDVSLSYSGDNGRDSVLFANIFLYGEEIGGDHTKVRKRWKLPIYTAPSGYVIKQITSAGRSVAYSINTKDNERPKPQLYGGCTTFIYTLSRASLGFDLRQNMVSDVIITTRNMNGPDVSGREGDIGCGFGIRSIKYRPLTMIIEKK